MNRASYLLLIVLFIGLSSNVLGNGELTAPTYQNIFNLGLINPVIR